MHSLLSIVGLSLLGSLTQAAPATQPGGNNNNGGGGGLKVGLAVGDKSTPDLKGIFGGSSQLSWYYTWSTDKSTVISDANSKAEFLPQINPDHIDLSDPNKPALRPAVASQLRRLRETGSTRLLCLNEPDGTVASGGTALAPAVAARYYKDVVVPLRAQGWQISHPATTSSDRGLDWLRQFRGACGDDCPADFVSVHWYGPADGLAWWVDKLDAFYHHGAGGGGGGGGDANRPKFWFTELGFPQGTAAQNQDFLDKARTYLNGKDFVEAYAWFGATRPSKANAWTGAGVSVFGEDGKPSDLGKMLMLGTSKSG